MVFLEGSGVEGVLWFFWRVQGLRGLVFFF